jgi:uncharacterized protein (TIGR02996 family)
VDHDPFLRQILAHPEDDGPRLVWADRLDERGDPRGEFIRVQCELAKEPQGTVHRGMVCKNAGEPMPTVTVESVRLSCPCRWCALWRRERELIPRAWWAWCCPDFLQGRQWSVCRDQSEIAVYAAAGPPEVELTCRIRRGLVGTVTLTCKEFFGGPCEPCGGSGYVLNEEAAAYDEQIGRHPMVPPAMPCPACRDSETGESTGRVEGLAAALFRAAPVTEVRLSDREPDAISDGRLAWWYTDPDWHRPGLYQHHWLPVELRPYLTGRICEPIDEPRPGVCGFDYGNSFAGTDGVGLARADLSAACVAVGRARAGLPALAPVAPRVEWVIKDWLTEYADDPDAVRRFCSHHRILAPARSAVDTARQCFPPDSHVSIRLERDPESDAEWLVVDVAVKRGQSFRPIESHRRFVQQWAMTTRSEARDLIRLTFHRV